MFTLKRVEFCVVLIFMFLMMIASISAQVATIGTGTDTNTTTGAAPINIFYRSIRTQTVYTAAELNAAGFVGGGMINSLAYYVTDLPLHNLPDFQIRMRHTTATDASAHIDGPYEQVYFSTLYSPTAGDWDTLILTTPFAWNGVDNILVDTAFSQVPAYSSSGQQRVFDSPNGMRFVRSDHSDSSDAITTTTNDYKSQVQLHYVPADTYDDDMAAFAISGPPNLSPGTEGTFSVSVMNMGSNTQNNYTIRLMTDDDTELASVTGTETLEQFETAVFDLHWTPTFDDEGLVTLWGEVDLVGDEFLDNNVTHTIEVIIWHGSGTEIDPWQIETHEHLNNVRNYLGSDHSDKHFIQTADIDLTDECSEGGAYWNDGEGWEPIGFDFYNKFFGNYDGNGHTIDGLYINRPETNYQGLFGFTDGATISNLGVTNVDITGDSSVGGLVGFNGSSSTITNSYSTGSVSGSSSVGGLVGRQSSSTITNSYSTGSVSGSSSVGGLVGNQWLSTVSNSYSTGSVSGEGNNVGGLVGINHSSSTITNSYSTGSVSGNNLVGGLVGINHSSSTIINSCYNYEEVLINNENVITIGALDSATFNIWLNNNLYLDIDDYLSYDGNSYLINSFNDFKKLLAFGQYEEYSYKLTTDLDLEDQPNFYIPFFSGSFDGNGFIINNLTLDMGSYRNIGLFGYTFGSTIENLGVTNVDITGDWYVGGLVGFNGSSSTITNSYSTGSVSGYDSVGGLVGYNRASTVTTSYSTGSVSGEGNNVGGLVGNQWLSTVSNSYSTGSVSGDDYVGGMVGRQDYSTSTVIRSYWDIQTSSQTSSAGGEGRFSLEMTYPYADNTYVGWNFYDIWIPDVNYTVNNGYPYHRELDEEITENPSAAINPHPEDEATSILPHTVLNWNAGFNEFYTNPPTGFRLSLGTDYPPTNLIDNLDLGFQFSYEPDSELDLNTTYYWQIVPYNDVGDAEDCPVWSFTTYNPNPILEYPNGVELWLSGTTRTIIWQENAPPELELYISFDNGNQWILITETDGTKGYHHYQVPSVNSNFCLIKIASVYNEDHYDVSDESFTISTSSTLPKVVLTYPSASGIHLKVGENANLTWTRQNVEQVALDFSSDDGVTWTEIVSDLDADSYQWEVPDGISANCRIKVRSEVDPEVLDISDNMFSVSKIELLSPDGGEIITSDYSGTYSFPIEWSADGMTNVRIEYSANDGASWSTVATSTSADTGLYSWSLPGNPTNEGIIRVSNIDNTAINDVSDDVFTIRNPIKLVNANGDGFITDNSLFNIRWLMQDIEPSHTIYWEYSPDNSTWTRINQDPIPAGDENMLWFVTTGLHNNMWLRAVEDRTNRIVGKSESSFRVTDKMLTIIAPNGGEIYTALSSYDISWDYNGLTSLNIFSSYDDGENWIPIASNIPATDLSYNWTVPNTPSHTCRIKLQDTTYSYMNLESEGNFTILPVEVLPPNVDFTSDVQSGDIPVTVQFTEEVEASVGTIASRLWDFGDENTSTEENPFHVYTEVGTYTVSLTVTNSFGADSTMTKVDYITALPNLPRIGLLSDDVIQFGQVYVQEHSDYLPVVITNSGSADLTINNIYLGEAEPHFEFYHNMGGERLDLLSGASSGIEEAYPAEELSASGFRQRLRTLVLQPSEIDTVFVRFTPLATGVIQDTLFIANDSVNDPLLAISLHGTGLYVPPKAPENVQITMDGYDAVITWDPVTENEHGEPITPDYYFVYFNGSYDIEGLYYFLARSFDTTHTHFDVGLGSQHMFYRVKTIKIYEPPAIRSDYREYVESYLEENLKEGMTEAEVSEVLRKLIYDMQS